jgi:hypothetical protein
MSGDRVFRAFAIVFGLLSFSNFTKPFEMQEEVGLVFFGERLSGSPNLLIAPLFGVYLATYAYCLWTKRRAALPLGVTYALYVTVNVWLFRVRSPDLVAVNSLYGITYVVIALAIAWGAVAFLVQHAGALRRADPTR